MHTVQVRATLREPHTHRHNILLCYTTLLYGRGAKCADEKKSDDKGSAAEYIYIFIVNAVYRLSHSGGDAVT